MQINWVTYPTLYRSIANHKPHCKVGTKRRVPRKQHNYGFGQTAVHGHYHRTYTHGVSVYKRINGVPTWVRGYGQV